jgi:hypothetical protein
MSFDEYKDDSLTSLIKPAKEKILSSYEEEFIRHTLKNRFNNLSNVYIGYDYCDQNNFYSLFTLRQNSKKTADTFYIRALEFAAHYQHNPSLNTNLNDVFIYKLKDKYFYALYCQSKLAYVDIIYLKSNFLRLALDVEEVVKNSFGLEIEHVFFVDMDVSDFEGQNSKISTVYLPERLDQKMHFNLLIAKKKGAKYYLYYITILSVLFSFLIADLFLSSLSFPNDKDFNTLQMTKEVKQEKISKVETLLNISKDFQNCLGSGGFILKQIIIEEDIMLSLEADSKAVILECINNKPVEIMMSRKVENNTQNGKKSKNSKESFSAQLRYHQ